MRLTIKTYVPTNSAKAVRTKSGMENLERIFRDGKLQLEPIVNAAQLKPEQRLKWVA